MITNQEGLPFHLSSETIVSELNPNAKLFLQVNDSDLAKQRLSDAVQGKLDLKGFSGEDLCVDLLTFDWVSGSDNRNWWWQVQQLSFFDWLRSGWNLLTEEEKSEYLEFSLVVFERWMAIALEESDSPLAWHDHASALRFRQVMCWFGFMCQNHPNLIDTKYVDLIVVFFGKHIQFLVGDENYTKHTNHGFDQVHTLYTFALLWSENESLVELRKLAVVRLTDEINCAFTAQGVHKENSPGYQKFMLERLRSLEKFQLLGDEIVSSLSHGLSIKARKFLDAITLPDSTLPLIGDTKGSDYSKYKRAPGNGIHIYDYSPSGYVIVKGLDNAGNIFHLIVKAAHDSHYHRHDDDLSFVLYFNGEVVLGDGGLYNHNEKDEVRLFLRSALAHNTIFLSGIKAVRLPKDLVKPTRLKLIRPYLVEGISYSYGVKIVRKIDFSKIHFGELIIEDSIELSKDSKSHPSVNFFIPSVAKCRSENDAHKFKTSKNTIEIKATKKPIKEVVVSGQEDGAIAAYSPEINMYRDATRLTLCFAREDASQLMHKLKVSM